MESNALVIGETALAVQCAQLLHSRSHKVVAACSPEGAPLQHWAGQAGVPHVTGIAGAADIAKEVALDYLFSIVNYRVLPLDLLERPRLAINYHDGPLPRYAGVYATSWAILNGETQHGITWHVMTARVDAGDILKRVPVTIAPEATVHDLNMKCYIGAYRGFAALLRELESGTVTREQQDLRQRTYYGPSKWGSTRISWDWTASQIDRFCRALAFHPEHNPIGEPVADLDGTPVYVRSATPCAGSGRPMGAMVEVAEDYIQVATATGDVRLRGVRSLDGAEWDLAALKADRAARCA